MSTALSWTELRASRQDLGSLLAFRRSGLTRHSRRRMHVVGAIVLLLTVAAAVGPAYLGGELPREHSGADARAAAVPVPGLPRPRRLQRGRGRRRPRGHPARAGDRLPRLHHDRPPRRAAARSAEHRLDRAGLDPARRHLLRARARTGSGPTSSRSCCGSLASTALAQVVGWLAEGVRRGRHGIVVFRTVVRAARRRCRRARRDRQPHPAARPEPDHPAAGAGLRRPGRTTGSRGRPGCSSSSCWASAPPCSVPLPARWALHRPMREELRLESGRHPAKANAQLGLHDDAAHRPCRRVAFGAAAPWPDGAGPDAGCGRARRQPRVADADHPAGAGRLRRRAAVRGEHLVPRRPRSPVARQPAGLAADRVPLAQRGADGGAALHGRRHAVPGGPASRATDRCGGRGAGLLARWSSPHRWSRPECAGASPDRSRWTCAAPGPPRLLPS